MLFRWEEIDHSLARLRLAELSIEMNQLIRADESRIRIEQRGNMNSNTVPSLLLKMQQDRADEWAQKTYEIYCDVWQRQGNEKSAPFLRAVFAHGISVVLRARAGAIASDFTQRSVRTSFPASLTQAHLRGLELNIRRMEARWRRRIEIEAKECEHADRITKLQLARVTSGRSSSQKENSAELLSTSNRQPGVGSGQPVPVVGAQNQRPVSRTEVLMSPEVPLVSQSLPSVQIPVGLQTTASPNPDPRVLPRSIPAPRYPGATDWQGVEIVFLSDHRIQIRVNGKLTAPQNYAELGFADGRSKNPNKAWGALRSLAEHRGVLKDGSQIGEPWPKVEKRIQEIRKVLRELFGISADPLPFVTGAGYQAVFKIRCGPSFDT